jgi:hypothetical protein
MLVGNPELQAGHSIPQPQKLRIKSSKTFCGKSKHSVSTPTTIWSSIMTDASRMKLKPMRRHSFTINTSRDISTPRNQSARHQLSCRSPLFKRMPSCKSPLKQPPSCRSPLFKQTPLHILTPIMEHLVFTLCNTKRQLTNKLLTVEPRECTVEYTAESTSTADSLHWQTLPTVPFLNLLELRYIRPYVNIYPYCINNYFLKI